MALPIMPLCMKAGPSAGSPNGYRSDPSTPRTSSARDIADTTARSGTKHAL